MQYLHEIQAKGNEYLAGDLHNGPFVLLILDSHFALAFASLFRTGKSSDKILHFIQTALALLPLALGNLPHILVNHYLNQILYADCQTLEHFLLLCLVEQCMQNCDLLDHAVDGHLLYASVQ